MTTQAKWRIERTKHESWAARNPDGPSEYFDSHAEAVAYVSAQLKDTAQAKVKANPKAAIALLVLAGLAAAAKKGKAGK